MHFIVYPITFNLKQSCGKKVYKGKLFKFNHSFAWKSLRQVVFELCSSEIKITYLYLDNNWKESNLEVITSKNKLFET